jgi:hypothetical protein
MNWSVLVVRRTFLAGAIDACNPAGGCCDGPYPSSRIYLKRLGVGPSEQGLQDQFKLSRLRRRIWPKFFFCKGDELHLGDTLSNRCTSNSDVDWRRRETDRVGSRCDGGHLQSGRRRSALPRDTESHPRKISR